jgi:Bacterial Ig-like domain (group 2)
MSRYQRFLGSTSLLMVAAMLAACDEPLVAPVKPVVRGLEVFPNPATVRVGEDLLMVSKVLADSGADLSLTWESSDPRRVRVTQTGIVTGVSVGPAVLTITADADPNFVVIVPVSVQPRYTGIRSITASPVTLSLIPGQTQAIAATVSADPDVSRAVVFTSDNPSVATVSSGGVVTALAVGLASVSVRSVVDSSVSATVPVTVRAASAARVSIQAVTSQGTNSPVDLQSVRGQVDVLINLEPGERTLSRVDLVINNNGRDTVVASQNFSPALTALTMSSLTSIAPPGLSSRVVTSATSSTTPSATSSAMSAAQTAVIVQSFRTDAFNAVSGAVAFRNAPTTIRAVAVEVGVGGAVQQSASSTVTAQLNNLDGFVLSVRPLASTITPTALDASGRRWFQAARGLEVTSTPVLFSGRALGTRIISYPGSSPVASVATTQTGVSVDTLRLPGSFSSASSGPEYVIGQLPSVLASDAVGNAMPLVSPLTNGDGGGVLNAQATFNSGVRLEGIRIDNAPPPAPTLTISSAQRNSNNWVNAAYQFASGLTNLAQDAGVGLPGGAGTPTVASANVQFLVGTPSQTDTVQVITGDELIPSETNTEYSLEAVLSDRLGNVRRVSLTPTPDHPGTRFGVDKVAPTVRYTQGSLPGLTLVSTNSDSVFTSATGSLGPRVYAVDVIDDRSGLPNDRVAITVKRFAPPNPTGTFLGTTTCIVGTGTACSPAFLPFETVLPDNYRQVTVAIDGGSGLEGYFTFAATAQDQAGNVSTPRTKRALIDAGTGESAPFITGLGVSGVLIGGDSARFLALATDNVELARGGIMLAYPNLPGTSHILAYGTPALGGRTIGTRFDSLLTTPIAGTHPAFTVPNFIRGLELVNASDEPQPYPGVIAKPNAANAWVTDFAFGGAPSTLAANVPIVGGSVQSPGPNPGFLAALGTTRELQKWRRVIGVTGLQFEAVGPSGQTVSPFARVLLVRLQPSGLTVNPTVWQVISELTIPLGTDNGLRRTWTYNFGSLSSGEYMAIGVTASGDAIATRIVVL